MVISEATRRRGNIKRRQLRERQRAGRTGSGAGKFTKKQNEAISRQEKSSRSRNSYARGISRSTPETTNTGAGPTIEKANAMIEKANAMNTQNRQLPNMSARDIERVKSGELKVSDEIMAAINSGEMTGEKESFMESSAREFDERGGWQTVLLALGESGAIDIALGAVKNTISGMGRLTAAMNKAASVNPTRPDILTNSFWKEMVSKGAKKGLSAASKAKEAGRLGISKKAGLTAVKSRIMSEAVFKKVMSGGKSKAWSAFKIVSIAGTVSAIVGQYVIGEWGYGDAMEGLDFVSGKVAKINDPELTAEFIATGNEIYDTTLWEGIQRLLPILNPIQNFGDRTKSLVMQWNVNKRYLTDMKENGAPLSASEIVNETTAIIKANQIEQIERQKEYKQWAIDLDNQDMLDDARFFRREASKRSAIAKQEREEIMLFWLEYRKLIMKMQDENRGSNLNFGFM